MSTLSIFDLPLITELATYSSKVNDVYKVVKPATLNSINPKKASDLQSTIQSRIKRGLTFLPIRGTTHYINLIVPDYDVIEVIRKYSLKSSPKLKFQFRTDGIPGNLGNVTDSTVFVISIGDTEISTKITVNNRSQFKIICNEFLHNYDYFIDDWYNVHLLSHISKDYKDASAVITGVTCFNPTKKNSPGLFSMTSPDGNISDFLAKYRIAGRLISSRYSLVTLKIEVAGTKTEFETSHPNSIGAYNIVKADRGIVSFVIRSDYVDYLIQDPYSEACGFENIHSLIYTYAVEVPDFKCRRRLTYLLINELPFSFVKAEPWADTYDQLAVHFNYVSKGSRMVGLVANKATGKSSLIKMLSTQHYYIDSDLYGQVITYIMCNNKVELYTSKDFRAIADDLSNVIGLDDKNVLVFKDYVVISAFETAADEYIKAHNVNMKIVNNSLPSAVLRVLKFKDQYDALTKVYPLDTYLSTITEVIPRLGPITPETRFIVFAHTSYELFSILGGCVFAISFIIDENVSILLRKRDSSPDTQVFLQRFYESLEIGSFNSIPCALLIDYIGEAKK